MGPDTKSTRTRNKIVCKIKFLHKYQKRQVKSAFPVKINTRFGFYTKFHPGINFWGHKNFDISQNCHPLKKQCGVVLNSVHLAHLEHLKKFNGFLVHYYEQNPEIFIMVLMV